MILMSTQRLNRPDGHHVAVLVHAGRGPTVVWLGGFKSEMTATKASHLAGWAARTGRSFIRFDYFGHGASSGAFQDGTITRWLDDALAVVDQLTNGPLVLVGSSMGGWLATHVALCRPGRVAAMVCLAPAIDMTETLLWAGMDPAARDQVMREGAWARPSTYDTRPYPITRALIEDGRRHLLLPGPIALDVPIRILHGQDDPDVPWRHSVAFMDALQGRDVMLTLVKGGDHRLSSPADLIRLEQAVAELSSRIDG